MMRRDIAIVGCGTAGLAAALLLVRDGHRVTLYERFDKPQPVGSGLMLQPTGMAVLRALGLDGRILDHGARVDRLLGKADGERVVLDVHYRALHGKTAFGVGIHRAALFAVLHDAVTAAAIPIETGRAIVGSPIHGGARRQLAFADGDTSRPFDLVVDAAGSRSPLARPTGRQLPYGALWATLDWPNGSELQETVLEQRYRAASVMIGVLPIGAAPYDPRRKAALFWSIRQDRIAAWRAAGLDAWKHQARAIWPAAASLLDQIHDADQLSEARYAHRTLARPAEPGLIHIGDSWHSASPQLGQGANMALLDAYALALALRETADIPTALIRAVRMRQSHIRLYQMLTAWLTPVYQSDSRAIPWIRDRIVGPLSKIWPITWLQPALVSGLVGWPLAPLRLED